MRVRVVGAGLGGLATAIRLARAGYDVEVVEKSGRVGGKLAEVRGHSTRGDFRFSAGPTLLTMPHVLDEIFEYAGERVSRHIDLVPLDPSCRYFWTDGTHIDEDGAFWARPDVGRYMEHASGAYQLSADTFLDHAPGDLWRAVNRRQLALLRHAPKVATTESLAQLNARFFGDRRLRQIFDRFASFNGSSPERTPAAFCIVPFVQLRHGVWHVSGGLARIPEALQGLAQRLGVRFRLRTEVRDLAPVGADVVVCNADVLTAHSRYLDEPARARRLLRPALSSSCYVLWLGVARRFPQLSHHNVFFSDRPAEELEQIYDRGRLPREPTIYLCTTCASGDHDAPVGCENWLLLVNAPADPTLRTDGYERVVLRRLARFGLALRDEEIVFMRRFGPRNFQARDNAWQGALYGWASHGLRASLLRPPLRHPRRPRLFFVGGTVHPGGGIPLVLRSAKVVAGLIERSYPAGTARRRRAALSTPRPLC